MNHYEGSNNHIDPSQAQFGPSNQDEIRSYINTYLDSTLTQGTLPGIKTKTIDCQKLVIPNGAIDVRKLGIIPRWRGNQSANQTLASGANSFLTWDTDVGNFEGLNNYTSMHSNTVNNTRVIFPLAGAYIVECGIAWNAAPVNASNWLGLLFNGTVAVQASQVPAAIVSSITAVMHGNAGDYAEAVFANATGVACATASPATTTYFAATYIGRYQ